MGLLCYCSALSLRVAPLSLRHVSCWQALGAALFPALHGSFSTPSEDLLTPQCSASCHFTFPYFFNLGQVIQFISFRLLLHRKGLTKIGKQSISTWMLSSYPSPFSFVLPQSHVLILLQGGIILPSQQFQIPEPSHTFYRKR